MNLEGEPLVHFKNQKIVCIFLVIFMFLSGMCFENIKTDSPLAYAPIEKSDSCIDTCKTAVIDVQACTIEMLGVRSYSGFQHLSNRCMNPKREIKLSFDFLGTNLLSSSEGRFYTSYVTFYSFAQGQKKLVLNYIHKSDGKKRI